MAKFTLTLSLGAVILIVASSMNSVWIPYFTRVFNEYDADYLDSLRGRYFVLQGAVLGLVSLIVGKSLPFIAELIGGNMINYSHMGSELALLFCGYIILGPSWDCQNYLMASDNGSGLMKINFAASVVGVSAWIVAMICFGVIGIYLGFFIQMLIRSIVASLWTRTVCGVKAKWLGSMLGVFINLLNFY